MNSHLKIDKFAYLHDVSSQLMTYEEEVRKNYSYISPQNEDAIFRK